MREQIEGSQAVARAVTLCRPQVIAAYPISPQTHIVESLSDRVRTGELAPAASTSWSSRSSGRCRPASAPPRPEPAPTPRPRARACSSWPRRSSTPPGLGLPIVMTVANRAIGAPDQHLERPLRRDGDARLRLDPALRRVQPGGGRPARPGLPARRVAVGPGDGLHGRLRAHPRVRGGGPARPGAGGRLPAAVRAAAGPRPRGAGDDRRDGRARGVHRGEVPHARQAGARPSTRSRRSPRSSGARSDGDSGGLVSPTALDDAETVVVALGLGARHHRGGGRRAARRGRHDRRARASRCFRPWPLAEVRERTGRQREPGGRRGEGLRRRRRRDRRPEHPRRAPGTCRSSCYDVVAGLGGRPGDAGVPARPAGRRARRPARPEPACTSSTSTRARRARAGALPARRRPGPHAEHMLRDVGTVASGAFD